ncbi:putative PurR-regulated permease PerM [Yoonia maritima]|uniref:Putative PurR-regulated permease PerM n=1 Tax=Yoonia maritima TaxID=1435347 RepID=A0A2T0VTE2_9RHOB|nr:AI-2E family transporter [Yoonia maritima]PRY74342.1 putative PurR-regulated permease PerM [Yoonia maritima]
MDDTHTIKNLLIGIFLILVFGAVYFARDMLLPIVVGVLVALTLSPIVRGGARVGVPQPVSACLLIFGATVLCGVGVYALSGPASEILDSAPEVGAELKRKLGFLSDSLAAMQDATDEVENLANGDAVAPTVAIQQPSLLAFAAGSVASFLSLGFVGMILALFILASGDLFYVKLVNALPNFADKKLAVKTVRDVERRLSHYLLTITLINAGLGVCIAGALYWLGLPDAVLWGVLAFALNFIPFVGAMIGVLAIGAYSIIAFDTLASGMVVPLVYLFLTSLEGQIITPSVLGKRLELNTVSVFLAVIVWSWLWNVPGALMAVPFLVVTKVICDNVEPLKVFGDFLGARKR